MAEGLAIIKGNKEEEYQSLLPQLKGLLTGETDLVANMANVAGRPQRTISMVLGWLLCGKK